MKQFYIFLAFLIAFLGAASAQTGPIIVQSGAQAWAYPDINTAVAQAPSGAYIYLPGGGVPYTSNPIVIDKEVHIIGAGFWPDSTNATNYSQLGNCNISLEPGCDNSTFEGFLINQIYSPNNVVDTISNVTIKRIEFINGLSLGSNLGYSPYAVSITANSFLIYNCIMNYYLSFRGRVQNTIISNNIIQGQYYDIYVTVLNNSFLNNIFLETTGNGAGDLTFNNCSVKNNIFIPGTLIYIYNYSNFKNNCLCSNSNFTLDTYSTASGNYPNTLPQNILPSYTAPFSYTGNYHVINGSVGDNGGDDGTDVGIYGGLYPWKEGAVPSNPHIRTAVVSPQPNPQGNIQVDIKVGAQGN